MSWHGRRAPRRWQRPLALEPLEDRLLPAALIGPLPADWVSPNQNPPAAVSQTSAAAAPDADAPPGGYAPGQTDTTPAPATTNAATPGAAQNASSYPASGTGATSASQSSRGDTYSSSSGNGHTAYTYPTAQGGESPAEYYPPAHEAATTATPAVTAIPGMTALATAAPAQPVLAAHGQAPAFLVPPPVPFVALAPAAVPAAPVEAAAPLPAEGVWEAFRSGLQAALANASAEESPASALPELQTGPVFPLSLPLPGGLLALDLANWQLGVRALFRRLDALDEELGEVSSLERLAPWCAALGAVTVAMELARRQRSQRYPTDLTETAGRGLAWKWAAVPPGGNPPESS